MEELRGQGMGRSDTTEGTRDKRSGGEEKREENPAIAHKMTSLE